MTSRRQDTPEVSAAGSEGWLAASIKFAKDARPGLREEEILTAFDKLAQPLVDTNLSVLPVWRQVQEISNLVYQVHGFRGNELDYDDPRNSLIDHVLERRLGIPISLALVYCEIARRAGVVATGVGFPGHFLVRVADRVKVAGVDRSLLVDPFNGGEVLDSDALSLLAQRVSGQKEVDPSWLQPSSLSAILVRTLTNLRAAYARRGDDARQLMVLSRLCELEPQAPAFIRERGLVQARLGAPRAAISDLEQYLDWAPQASDVQNIQDLVDQLRHRLHRGGAKQQPN